MILAAALPVSVANAAELTPWRIIPAESLLGFTAHDAQNGSITGGFGTFSGTILFDPERLAESRISIDVDVTSVQAGLPDAAADLPKPEWLGVAAFPRAHYESRTLRKRPDGQYEAEGSLQLKGVTAPVTLTFVLPTYTAKHAVAKGTARLSRGAFKVGDSDLVKDPVDLTFTVTAMQP
jgi:polyisoprenoid-binding protein YceI